MMRVAAETGPMFRALQAWTHGLSRALFARGLPFWHRLLLLAGCSGNFGDLRPSTPTSAAAAGSRPISAPARSRSASSCRSPRPATPRVAAQSMRNAAEMALAEFNSPDVQLLVKDDGGTAPAPSRRRSRRSTKAPRSFSGRCSRSPVGPVGQAARAAQCSGHCVLDRRQRRGPRRLSAELPAGVRRRPHRRLRRQPGQALVRRADSGQRLWQRGGSAHSSRWWRAAAAASSRSSAIPLDKAQMQAPVKMWRRPLGEPGRRDLHAGRRRCRGDGGADADASGVDLKRVQLLGTGLWEDPQIFSNPQLEGAWYAGPELDRLPQFLRPLPQPLRPGPRAHRHTLLRCGRARGRPGQDPGQQRFSEAC